MTEQEIFDTVVNHLRTMPGRSMARSVNFCAYRGDNGNKCAVGVLLTDEEYSDMGGNLIESSGVHHLATYKKFPAHLKPHVELLGHLQHIHDNAYNWNGDTFTGELALAALAKDFNLTYTEPQK